VCGQHYSELSYRFTQRFVFKYVLSGGTTLFNNFNKRLGDEMQARIDERLRKYKETSSRNPVAIICHIFSPPTQRYAVWDGASQFAASAAFKNLVHTREEYMEYGPSIARRNVVFRGN
jgi:actin-related protein 3